MAEPIPVANPGAAVGERQAQILSALKKVLQSGRYVGGESVEGFESDFAAVVGAEHCVAVGSGTEALTLALLALGIGAGHEVVTAASTAVATVAAIESTGADPVLMDVDPVSRCLDPAGLQYVVSERTRAVIPVHLYGQPADMSKIVAVARQLGLKVVEDAAQAVGASIGGRHVGTFGDAAAFSFYPTKNLGAVGDAGAVVTQNPDLAARVRRLAQYGWDDERISREPGRCSRMDPMQAAVLQVQLEHLPRDSAARRSIAARYGEALASVEEVQAPTEIPGTEHAFHLYVVESDDRDGLAEHLRRQGIATSRHYPRPIHREPAYDRRLRRAEDLSVSERLARRILTLPLYPQLQDAEVEHIAQALQGWSGARS